MTGLWAIVGAAAAALTGGADARLERGPVVTRVDERSAVVSWQASARAATAVEIDGRRVAGPEGLEAEVRVGGLEPGTRYRYRVLAGATAIGSGSFRTAPDGDAAPVTVAVMADLGPDTRETRRVARLATGWRPDLAVMPGDISSTVAIPGTLDQHLFRPYAPLLATAAAVPAVGNHDVLLTGGTFYREAFALPPPERWYVQRFGALALLVLDSNLPLGPRSPQGRFLARAVEGMRDACVRVAVFHHPPSAPVERGIAPHLREHLLPVLEAEGFRAVLVGHTHAYARGTPVGGVTQLLTGTGGARLAGSFPTLVPSEAEVLGRHGALRLDWRDGRLRGRFVTTDGVVQDRFDLGGCG